MDNHSYAATKTAVPTAVDSDDVAAPSSAAINASAPGIEFVRVLWIDTSGQHRCSLVPEKRFHDVVTNNGIGIPCAVMGVVSLKDSIAIETNLTEVGEIRLIPDLSTKAIIPWAKGQEMVISDMHLKPGTPWDLCPRETLRRLSKVLKDELNLVMNAGFENEFYLLRRELVDGKETWVPYDKNPYCSTTAIDDTFPLLSEIVASLHSLNIVVEQVHSEIGYGQYEVVLGYTSCEQAADNLVYTREIIRSVARKHGLLATFVPNTQLMIWALDHMSTSVCLKMDKMYTWDAMKKIDMECPKSGRNSCLEFWTTFLQYWHSLHQFQIVMIEYNLIR